MITVYQVIIWKLHNLAYKPFGTYPNTYVPIETEITLTSHMRKTMDTTTLSAIVTGNPPGLRSPKPLPGETWVQMIIRNFPDEWQNCIERMNGEFGFSDGVKHQLRKGDLSGVTNPLMQDRIARFVNFQSPTHGRTLYGLADLRNQLRKPDAIGGLNQGHPIQLIEILWPHIQIPSRDGKAEQLAKSLDVTIIKDMVPGSMDVGSLLNYIHGDFVWILPGGSRISSFASLLLFRILNFFQENPNLAVFSDMGYCIIIRTEALRMVTANAKRSSSELQNSAKLMKEAGYDAAGDSIFNLVEIEPLYGGKPIYPNENQSKKRHIDQTERTSWWRRRLGL